MEDAVLGHIQVSKEVAVIQEISRGGTEQQEKAEPIFCSSRACEMMPNSTEQSRSFFGFQKGAPCLIEIFTTGWEGRNETPWTVAKPTIQFVPLPPEEQQ